MHYYWWSISECIELPDPSKTHRWFGPCHHHPLYRPVACACMSCSEKWHKKQSPWSLNFKTSPGARQEKKCWFFLKDWFGLEKMLSPMVCNVLIEACKIYLLYPFTVGILELFHYKKCLVIKYWTPKDWLTRMKSSRIWCIGHYNKIWMVRRCSMVVFNSRLLSFEVVVYFILYEYVDFGETSALCEILQHEL